ncbi:unnamed protein product [Caenorhabditis brenneri]
MNQSVGYGLIVMGSLTQMMITINRFLVVYFTLYSRVGDVSKYSNQVTVFFQGGQVSRGAVVAVNGILFKTLPHKIEPGPLGMVLHVLFHQFWVFNVCYTPSRKLIVSAKNQSLSSEMSKKRRENAKKFFFQSLCQDWIYVLQMIICYYFIRWFEKDTVGQFMSEMGCDVLVPVVDGLIMFSFNYRGKKTLREIKNSNNSDSMKAFEKPKISVCSVR